MSSGVPAFRAAPPIGVEELALELLHTRSRWLARDMVDHRGDPEGFAILRLVHGEKRPPVGVLAVDLDLPGARNAHQDRVFEVRAFQHGRVRHLVKCRRLRRETAELQPFTYGSPMDTRFATRSSLSRRHRSCS